MVPKIEFFPITYDAARSFDLTALTSAGGVWNELQGYAGADWFAQREGNFSRQKTQGGFQLTPQPFTDGPAGMPSFAGSAQRNAVSFLPQDSTTETNGSEVVYTTGMNTAGIGPGMRWLYIDATREIRTANFIVWNYGAVFVATAHFTDGSYPDTNYTLPSDGPSWFKVRFAARTPCKLELKIKATTNVAGYLVPSHGWLELPIPEVRPRHLYTSQRGHL